MNQGLRRISLQAPNSCVTARAKGPLADVARPGPEATRSFAHRLANACTAAEAARGTGWRPLLADVPLRSGILLLQSERPDARQASPEALRAAFHSQGLALTVYEGGIIRLSMPPSLWRAEELDLLRNSLEKIA